MAAHLVVDVYFGRDLGFVFRIEAASPMLFGELANYRCGASWRMLNRVRGHRSIQRLPREQSEW